MPGMNQKAFPSAATRPSPATVTSVGTPVLPIGSQPENAAAFFRPTLRKIFGAAVEAVLRIFRPDRGQISGDLGAIVAFDRGVVDVAWQEDGTVFLIRPGYDVVLLTALSAEANGVQPGSGSVGVFELSIEKDCSRLRAKRGEYFARACDEAVEFEGEERLIAVAATFFLREANQRQEALQSAVAHSAGSAPLACASNSAASPKGIGRRLFRT